MTNIEVYKRLMGTADRLTQDPIEDFGNLTQEILRRLSRGDLDGAREVGATLTFTIKRMQRLIDAEEVPEFDASGWEEA